MWLSEIVTDATSDATPDATPDALMKAVVDRYLRSGDFNGLYLHTNVDTALVDIAKRLVADRKLQVMVSGLDYPNPHIRPWPSKRTIESQIESLDNLAEAVFGVVLYPTPSALKGVRVPSRLKGHPFGTSMAKGRGTLELAYFSLDVLEPYRNDPRYSFRYSDFGVDMSIADEAFLDETEHERDKVSLSHLGLPTTFPATTALMWTRRSCAASLPSTAISQS